MLAAGEAGQQHILQPACTQAIAILAASADRNIVAVADGANPGVLTAWHVRSRTCLGSWTAVHGIAALHLSADGSHAALLSRIDAANDQQVLLLHPKSDKGDGEGPQKQVQKDNAILSFIFGDEAPIQTVLFRLFAQLAGLCGG